jgi:hypothetical protein
MQVGEFTHALLSVGNRGLQSRCLLQQFMHYAMCIYHAQCGRLPIRMLNLRSYSTIFPLKFIDEFDFDSYKSIIATAFDEFYRLRQTHLTVIKIGTYLTRYKLR